MKKKRANLLLFSEKAVPLHSQSGMMHNRGRFVSSAGRAQHF